MAGYFIARPFCFKLKTRVINILQVAVCVKQEIEYVDDGIVKLKLEMQIYTRDEIAKAIAPLQARIDALRNHIDRISRWGLRDDGYDPVGRAGLACARAAGLKARV
jgi:hypothetical protein